MCSYCGKVITPRASARIKNTETPVKVSQSVAINVFSQLRVYFTCDTIIYCLQM